MRRDSLALWVSAFVFPPLGLVLGWMRREWGVVRRVIFSLFVCLIGTVELLYLGHAHDFFGLHLMWNGDMSRIISVSFESRSQRAARLEASRAKQQVESPAPASPVTATPAVAAAASIPDAPKALSYWSDFRGPNRAGEYAEMPIRTDWPASGLPQVWKQPIGGGYASFTVGEGRAYTIEQRRENEAVTAYDLQTGRELWAFTYQSLFAEMLGGPGPRATPVYHDGFVYALSPMGQLFCLSAKTGMKSWSRNILTDNGAENVQWGMAGSPLIVDDKVVVTPGGHNGKSIVAYGIRNGIEVWQSLNDRAAYTSPMVATLAGKRQIVWISAQRAVGVAIEDGKLLWEYPFLGMYDMNCAQPVIVDGSHVLLSSTMDTGSALLEITNSGDGLAAHEVWKNKRLKNKFSSSVLHDGYVYGFDDSILACIDPKTGELKWKGGRYGFGQLLLAGDHLVVVTEDGDIVLVKATPAGHQELARFSALQGRTWNVPAIDSGLLLVRNTTEMAAYRIGAGKEKSAAMR